MVDQKLEEILWAEYERITRGQEMQSLNALPTPKQAGEIEFDRVARGLQLQSLSERLVQNDQMQQVQSLSEMSMNPGKNDLEPITARQEVDSASDWLARNDASESGTIAGSKGPASVPFVTSAKEQSQKVQQEKTSGNSVGSKLEAAALDFGKNRLNAMPLISTLVNLFGGGGDAAPPQPLVKYAMPPSIHISAANSRQGSGIRSLDYGQDGMVRAYTEPAAASPAWRSNGTAQQILVNVQAMDSRSFMDHSQEIAQAVREAMLNMHALNDVVSEL
jgi:hypothetical protein